MVLNLVVNAAQAIEEALPHGAPSRGHIVVATRVAGDGVEIEVTDSGAGIPEAIRHRIFEPFFTTKDVGKGTGQGLQLVHRIVTEKHGGQVTYTSRVGHGTTFVVRLPLE